MLLDLYVRACNEKDSDKRRLLIEQIFRLVEEQQKEKSAGPKINQVSPENTGSTTGATSAVVLEGALETT